MATIRDGDRGVLLVVDVQVGVMRAAWEAPRVIDNVARLVQRARDAAAPVIWVQHSGDDLPRDSDAWQWVPELTPAADELRVHKRFESSFEDTSLDAALADLGATHIVLAGAASNWCIRATAYGALDRGYDLTLVRDAHSTGDMDLGDGNPVTARSIIQDLNAVMTWIQYPGRSAGTAATEAVDFTAPGGAR